MRRIQPIFWKKERKKEKNNKKENKNIFFHLFFFLYVYMKMNKENRPIFWLYFNFV